METATTRSFSAGASLLLLLALLGTTRPAAAEDTQRMLPRSLSGELGLGVAADDSYTLRTAIDAQPLPIGAALLLGVRLTYGAGSGLLSGGSHNFLAVTPTVTFTDFGGIAPTLGFGVGPAYIETFEQTTPLGPEPSVDHAGFGVLASGSLGLAFRAAPFSCGPELLIEGGSVPFAAALQFAVGWSEPAGGTR